jgi:hypothetical protein
VSHHAELAWVGVTRSGRSKASTQQVQDAARTAQKGQVHDSRPSQQVDLLSTTRVTRASFCYSSQPTRSDPTGNRIVCVITKGRLVPPRAPRGHTRTRTPQWRVHLQCRAPAPGAVQLCFPHLPPPPPPIPCPSPRASHRKGQHNGSVSSHHSTHEGCTLRFSCSCRHFRYHRNAR